MSMINWESMGFTTGNKKHQRKILSRIRTYEGIKW